jgi:SAM-dependent methyltransferase
MKMIPYTIAFTVNNFKKEEISNKCILEVGSRNVNGSLRPIFELWNPSKYVGIDIQKGSGVDIICAAEEIVEKFGENSFDIVVSSDALEHIFNWKDAISNIKNVCKVGGKLLISVPSIGFPNHFFPNDFWRYQTDDLRNIFSDFVIIKLEKSYPYPGLIIKCEKPKCFQENNIDLIQLYKVGNEV